jgi:hypothetical protein
MLDAASGVLTPVSFTATGAAAAFNIEVRYYGATTPTANQQAAFTAAETEWETLIFGDLTNVDLNFGVGVTCGSGFPDYPAVAENVDDLLIFAKVEAIDGPGGILGGAAPCRARVSGGLPVIGVMLFDSADLADLESSGQLNLVILHEMGHVLGFGTIWNQSGFSLLAAACPSPSGCSTDPHFTGARAITAFNELGGAGYAGGAKVPVENCVSTPGSCGDGTVNSHWRESILDSELMTGYLNGGANPLSALSVASLLDMSYQVNYSGSDSYTVPGATPGLRAARSGRVRYLGDDVLPIPLGLVDAGGKPVGSGRP